MSRSDNDLVFFCRDGHVTPADRIDPNERLWHFKCRRKNPAYLASTGGRCHSPVKVLSAYPSIEAAFKIGGEPAVQAMADTWQSWDWG